MPDETNVIRVRYWAAARAAAGTDSDVLSTRGPMSLAQVRAAVLALHPGTRLGEVLRACSALIGEHPAGTADPADVEVAPGVTVEFLPPFAGG